MSVEATPTDDWAGDIDTHLGLVYYIGRNIHRLATHTVDFDCAYIFLRRKWLPFVDSLRMLDSSFKC